jgi:hypothetical protein
MDMVLPLAFSLLVLLGLVAAIAGYESRDGYRAE